MALKLMFEQVYNKISCKNSPRMATSLLIRYYTFVLGPLMNELRFNAFSYEVELGNMLSTSALPLHMKRFHVETIEMELVPIIQAVVVIINTAKASQFESECLAPVVRNKISQIDTAFKILKDMSEELTAFSTQKGKKQEEETADVKVDIIGKVDWMLIKSKKKKANLKFVSEAVDKEWQVLNLQKDMVPVE